MDRNEDKFREQEAPLKNTDQAFVQVGEDGHPQMPKQEEEGQGSEEQQALKGDEARKHH